MIQRLLLRVTCTMLALLVSTGVAAAQTRSPEADIGQMDDRELYDVQHDASNLQLRLAGVLLNAGSVVFDDPRAVARAHDAVVWDTFGAFKLAGWRVRDEHHLEALIDMLDSRSFDQLNRTGVTAGLRQELVALRGRIVEDHWSPDEGYRDIALGRVSNLYAAYAPRLDLLARQAYAQYLRRIGGRASEIERVLSRPGIHWGTGKGGGNLPPRYGTGTGRSQAGTTAGSPVSLLGLRGS